MHHQINSFVTQTKFAALLTLTALIVPTSVLNSAHATETVSCNLGGSGPEINACAREKLESAERTLKRTSTRISKTLAPPARRKFQTELQAWLDSRYAECREVLHELEGYTIWVSEYHYCLADLTKSKNQKLRSEYLNSAK